MPRSPLAAALALTALGALPARAAPPCAACVRWELGTEQARGLLETGEPLTDLELTLRGPDEDGLAAALAARGARVGLVQGAREPLRETGPPPDSLLIQLSGDAPLDEDEAALRVKTLGTALRARAPTAAVGLEAPAEVQAALWRRGLAAYVDFVVGGPAPPGLGRWVRLGAAETLSVPRVLAASRGEAAERLLVPWPAGGAVALSVRALRDVFPAGASGLPEVTVACEGERAPACASEVFLHPRTLEAVALVEPHGATRWIRVRPGARAAWWQPLAGDAFARAVPIVETPEGARIEVPPGEAPFVLRLAGWSAAGERFAAGIEVVDEKALTAGEIVARHQAAAARQRRLVPRYVAAGATVLAFQAPGLAPPVTLTADTVVYASGETMDIEQRDLRLNGVPIAVARDGVPRLPLVEPERVGQAPMAIALDDAYAYRLAGRERVDGEEAYVVAFEPRDPSRARFRGRAWIAVRGFALLRQEGAQTALRGAIVSSEQRDAFVRVAVGGEAAWLLARSEVDQVYEGAGHRTPIHRVLTLERHEPVPADFDARLRAAHASASVMLRETPAGFRYLRRAPPAETPGAAAEAAAGRAVVPRGPTRVRTVAAGALVDPNISTALPFAGLNYLDFDFLGTGAQLDAFFAGAFLQAAVAVPSLGGTRWQLHGSAFATLAEYNDRVFRDGQERYDENLRQRPARLALAVARPLSPRWLVRAGYELGYTRLRPSALTAPAFVAPASALVHALRVSLDGQRGPWTGSVWWSPAWRQGWRAWGWPDGGDDARGHAEFQRFGASVGRSLVFSPSALLRLEAAWMSGRDLDRFSRYTFDAFDNRLRGYPSAGLRFDRGAVFRTVTAWTIAPGVRLDAFADTAVVRDPGFGSALRAYSGVGAGVEAPLPWRTLLAAEWGYGFQGRDRAGAAGTHVFRVTAYKVF
jgi:hypothetical protein